MVKATVFGAAFVAAVAVSDARAESCQASFAECMRLAGEFGSSGSACRQAFRQARSSGFFATRRHARVKLSRACSPDNGRRLILIKRVGDETKQ